MSFTQMFTNSGSPPMRDPKFKERGEPLDARTVEYAHSIESIDTLTQLFKRYDSRSRYTLGDILGQVIFHPRPTESLEIPLPTPPDATTTILSLPREIPAWSYAMPVIGKTTSSGDVKAYPIYNRDFVADGRFEGLGEDAISLPNEGSLADGQVGLLVGGTKEDGDIENLFLPLGDSALIAVNNDFSDPSMSSIVYDVGPGIPTETSKALSETDQAPLHTFWRVIRPSFDFVGTSGRLPLEPDLAWQMASPKYSRIGHAACYDYSTAKKGIAGFVKPPLDGSGKPPPIPPGSGEAEPPGGAGGGGGGAGGGAGGGGAGGGDGGGGAGGSPPPPHGGDGRGKMLPPPEDPTGSEKEATRVSAIPLVKSRPVVGYGGYRLGGPFFVGEIPDKHFLGNTLDGEEEFSLHLDTMTLFKRHGGFKSDFDAPLKFEGLYHKDDPLPYPKKAHIRYDPCDKHKWLDSESREGYWKIQTESEIAGSDDDDLLSGELPGGTGGTMGGGGAGFGSSATDDDSSLIDYFADETPSSDGSGKTKPPPPTCYDLLEDRRKEIESSGSVKIFSKYSNSRSDASGQDSYRFTPFPMGFGEILGKPHPTIFGFPDIRDYRFSTVPQILPFLDAYKKYSPITSRLLFFGGVQGDQNEPEYTQRRGDISGRYNSGTGPGGIVLMPPEINDADIALQNSNGGHIPEIENNEVSETSFSLVPGVRLFFGYPDLSIGKRKYGWSAKFDYSTDQLFWDLKESSGTETTLLKFPNDTIDPFEFISDIQTNKDIIWKSGTSFKGTQSHANSADRTYTFPNASGTVALTSDIPSGAGLWTLATDVVKTTTNTHHVAFNDTYLNHGVTDTNTGFKIGSDTFTLETGGNEAANFDSSQTLNVVNQISWKDNTSFKGILTHANSGSDKTYTFPNNSGTVALATGLSGGQTIYGGTGSGDDLTLIASSNATDGNIVFGSNSELILYTDGGVSPYPVGTLYLTGDFHWESGTGGSDGQLIHNNSADRDYTFPDETGQVKLKKDHIVFFPSNQSTTFSKHSVDSIGTGGGLGYVEFLCPNDFSSLTSLVAIIISGGTDASVDIDFESEYGASGEDHATHTGASTGTNYNLKEGRLTEISVSSVFASLAAGDYCGLEVQNNDALTIISLVGVRMAYTPTN